MKDLKLVELKEMVGSEDGFSELGRIGGEGVRIVAETDSERRALEIQSRNLFLDPGSKRFFDISMTLPLLKIAESVRGVVIDDMSLEGVLGMRAVQSRDKPFVLHSDFMVDPDARNINSELPFTSLHRSRNDRGGELLSSDTIIVDVAAAVDAVMKVDGVIAYGDRVVEHFSSMSYLAGSEAVSRREIAMLSVLFDELQELFLDWCGGDSAMRFLYLNSLMEYIRDALSSDEGKISVVEWIKGRFLLFADIMGLHGRVVDYSRKNAALSEGPLFGQPVKYKKNVAVWPRRLA